MDEPNQNSALVIASKDEFPGEKRVWGTGGWIPPEEREALDWLTLLRMTGWGTSLKTSDDFHSKDENLSGKSWVVLACEPDSIGEEAVASLKSKMAAEPVLIIARAGSFGSRLANLAGVARKGAEQNIKVQTIEWREPEHSKQWFLQNDLEVAALEYSEDASVAATIDGEPLIVTRRIGRGTIATLAFHPSVARDRDGSITALLRHLLIYASSVPAAWLDWEGTLVLRMDDPGGAQNIYSRSWYYPKLGEKQWDAIISDLKKRSALLSIGYTAGWVDDGDEQRGELTIDGHCPIRVSGQIHPSPLVNYLDVSGHAPGTRHDYESEYRGIQKLRASGLGDVEMHGCTHIHPDRQAWLKAADRYESNFWYRELGKSAAPVISSLFENEHPLNFALELFRKYFQARPTTLISPGDQWTDEVLERALTLGLQLVSSYYLAIRDENRFCWATHVCAPYLNTPDGAWFNAGLPVVGYFHDRELSLEGVNWMSKWLDSWQAAGAKRLIDFRETAAALGCRFRLEKTGGALRLVVTDKARTRATRPFAVNVYVPETRLPSKIKVVFKNREFDLPISPKEYDSGSIALPLSDINSLDGKNLPH